MIQEIVRLILKAKQETPLRVGIDGVDAAGKTFLANQIAASLSSRGHPVLRASIDGFHNPKQVRYQRGPHSPEGYYYDSFNYPLLITHLLEPLSPNGSRRVRLSAFDFKTDSQALADELQVANAHILVFEGVFLFRPELRAYWDLKIFVEIDFQTSLARALERDSYLFGDEEAIRQRYRERYIPGQKIYLETERPQTRADIVIDNHDFDHPVIIAGGRTK